MYPSEKIYRSILYFAQQIVPSGVVVVDGQEFGIRVDDPTGKSPSVAVTIGDTGNAALELGSFGTQYPVYFTINAKSRMQRDALKDIVRSGVYQNLIPIYSDFTQFVPTSGAVIEQFAELGDYFQARDMPNFESDRESFFWNAVVAISLDVLGL
jgi:hypothetical protein